MNKRVLAVIPAYNEEENIVSTIEDLRKNAPDIDYVIVNDGSRDSTAAICRERGYHLISLPVNLGLAGAFQTGMKYAYAHGYDYAIQFDADGQHSAAYIDDMVEVAEETGANVVVGSRFADCKKPFSARMAGSALITAMIFVTTRKRIEDPTSGMRLFDSKMIPLFANELDFAPSPTPSRFSCATATRWRKCRWRCASAPPARAISTSRNQCPTCCASASPFSSCNGSGGESK